MARIESDLQIEIKQLAEAPKVFDYSDYREYLKDHYRFRKAKDRRYSFGYFSAKAGIRSRSYLKRVMDGERSLSSENVPKFTKALELSTDESLYFEILVNYNQAKDPQSKKYYFDQLSSSGLGIKSDWIEISKSQTDVMKCWYIVPIFELLDLNGIEQDPNSISKLMKQKVTPKEAQEALEVLSKLGLIRRNAETKRWEKTTQMITYDQNVYDVMVRHYHQDMLKLCMESTTSDGLGEIFLKALSLAVKEEDISQVVKEMGEFIRKMNKKYSAKVGEKDRLIQLNSQLLILTKKKSTREEK